MPLDISRDGLKGLRNYEDGLAAEAAVSRYYVDRGAEILAERWRGKSGEIDLICTSLNREDFVFVEVKKSRTASSAAASLSQKQLGRISRAAEEYIAQNASPFSTLRIDLATVDQAGRIDILENLTLF